MPTLASLPPEIIIAVISHLIPSAPQSETKGRDAWLLWRTEWQYLLNLSLSCRALGQITRPFLCHTVALGSGGSIAVFLAFLLKQPHVRWLIRDLFCLVDLTTPAASRAADEAAQSRWLRTVHSPWQILAWAGCDPKDIDGREGRNAIRAFNAILCLAPRLRTLLLDFTEGYPRLDHILPALHSVSALPVPSPDPNVSPGLEPRRMRAALLGSLSDLRIRFSRRICRNYVTYLDLVLSRLPALTSLELFRFHGLLTEGDPTPTPTAAPQLRHVELLDSFATASQVAELCQRCPRLRTLAAHYFEWPRAAPAPVAGSGVHPHHHHPNQPGASASSFPGTGPVEIHEPLNDALAALAPSLESLELLTSGQAPVLGPGDDRDDPGHVYGHGVGGNECLLACLPRLTSLRHLTVNLRVALCGPNCTGRERLPQPPGVLPPSMETVIILVGDLWSFFVLDSLAICVSRALRQLLPVVDACDNSGGDDHKRPALRRVTLRLDLSIKGGAWETSSRDGTMTTGGRARVKKFWAALEPERRAYAELGVEFVGEQNLR